MSYMSGPGIGEAATLSRMGVNEEHPIVVQATPSQTGSLIEYLDTGGNILHEVGSNGSLGSGTVGFLGTAPVAQQIGASAAAIAAITDANAKAAISALQTALAAFGLVTSPA